MAELASRPLEEEKKELWYRHNVLQTVRPLVFCDPEGGWSEVIPDESLNCEGELARRWELFLRKEIFWGESMQNDKVKEPYFNIPLLFSDNGILIQHNSLQEFQPGLCYSEFVQIALGL